MGVMPEVMSKGPIFLKLDARYRNVGLATLRVRRDALRNLPPYPFGSIATLPTQGPNALSVDDVIHIRAHWFNETVTTSAGITLSNAGWWQGPVQPIEPILREGFITAIEVAIREPGAAADRPEPGLPIVFSWVCHPVSTGASGPPGPKQEQPEQAQPASDAVKVSVSWSERQVNLIIHTPDPQIPSPLTNQEPIYVVKRDKASGIITRVRP